MAALVGKLPNGAIPTRRTSGDKSSWPAMSALTASPPTAEMQLPCPLSYPTRPLFDEEPNWQFWRLRNNYGGWTDLSDLPEIDAYRP